MCSRCVTLCPRVLVLFVPPMHRVYCTKILENYQCTGRIAPKCLCHCLPQYIAPECLSTGNAPVDVVQHQNARDTGAGPWCDSACDGVTPDHPLTCHTRSLSLFLILNVYASPFKLSILEPPSNLSYTLFASLSPPLYAPRLCSRLFQQLIEPDPLIP